jgi:hypothetical protein
MAKTFRLKGTKTRHIIQVLTNSGTDWTADALDIHSLLQQGIIRPDPLNRADYVISPKDYEDLERHARCVDGRS